MAPFAVLIVGLTLFSAVVSGAAVMGSIWLSHRLEIYDKPGGRKIQRNPVPYLGGLGMLLGFFAGMMLFALLLPGIVFLHGFLIPVIVTGAAITFLLGFTDDVHPISALIKLLLQILIASGMWSLGVRIEVFTLLGEGSEQLGAALSLLLTVGWYVALMNSINLVDGLDGLAGGICMIGALSLVGIAFVAGYSESTLIGAACAAITAGVALGFLIWNWHPAKTFMGDGGSLLLGYLLGTSSIIGSTKTGTALALAIPMVALGLPLFETAFSFLRRAIKGNHPFKPDRRHIHHRLLDIGLDQRRVVIVLLFCTAFLGINSVLMANIQSSILLMNVLFLISGIVLMIENIKFLERQRESQETARQPEEKKTAEREAVIDPPVKLGLQD